MVLACNQIEYLLGKAYHDAACHGEKPRRSLRSIVTFETQAHLHDTKGQNNHTYGFYQAEYKGRKVVYHLQRVIGSQRRAAQGKRQGQDAEDGEDTALFFVHVHF